MAIQQWLKSETMWLPTGVINSEILTIVSMNALRLQNSPYLKLQGVEVQAAIDWTGRVNEERQNRQEEKHAEKQPGLLPPHASHTFCLLSFINYVIFRWHDLRVYSTSWFSQWVILQESESPLENRIIQKNLTGLI